MICFPKVEMSIFLGVGFIGCAHDGNKLQANEFRMLPNTESEVILVDYQASVGDLWRLMVKSHIIRQGKFAPRKG